MKRRVSSSLRHVGLAAMLAAGLIAAPSALGAAPPTDLASTPASPGGTGNWTFTWTDGVPELAGPVSYEGGLVGSILDLPVNAPLTSGHVIDPPEGNFWFKVRSVEPGAVESAYATLPITVDETGPTATLSLSGPSGGVGGWFRSPLNVVIGACDDAVAGIAPAQCANRAWTLEGDFAGGSQAIQLTDLVGNTSNISIPTAFGYDATRPAISSGGGTAPVAPGALVASEPTFEWSPGLDLMSGIQRYQLVFSTDADFGDEYTDTGGQVIANRTHAPGGNFTATRDPDLRPAPLPENVALKWWVRSIDKAGNLRRSSAFDLKIDPTVPPAPSITGGPNAPTQDTGPTFTWQGSETNFHWELTSAGSQQPIRQGGGENVTQTTLAALPDGDYVFRLTQITEAGQSSAEATRSFKVDTTAPTAPTITARPTFPSIGVSPTFSWTTEPGAFSRWSVVNAAGAVVGPIDTPVTSAELPALAEGPYTFQVVQIDPAGNVSAATTEGFTVIAPLVPAPGDDAQATFLASLPKQNALRLKPKAGTTLPTLRPVLRWKKGPRGTKLYNLQIFQVTKRKNNAKPKVTKVLSRFPRSLQFRTPSKGLKAGTCYVWRVWPYTGTAFTTRPVGVSNFCVASKTVLRKKALAALAAKKAAQRRAAIARRR